MASGPEGRYIAKVHRQLDKQFKTLDYYRMSNTNPFVGGVPDQYYEGPNGCLWAEYKYIEKLPKVLDLTKLLSSNQINWLQRATNNHGNTVVILGTATGEGVWFENLSWEIIHQSQNLKLLSPKEIAQKIYRHL